MDTLVDNIRAHDGSRELWCIDAHKENIMLFSPSDELVGKQGGVTKFNREFFCACFFDEAFQYRDISKRWWELKEIVMNPFFKRGEEFFEPLKTFNS